MVVADINMPRMDGLSLLQKLQESEEKLSTIIVSAYGDIANIRTAMNRGAFDFLTKPIDFLDLETIVTVAAMRRAALGRKLSYSITSSARSWKSGLFESPSVCANQFEFAWLLNRKSAGFAPFRNLVHIAGRLTKKLGQVRTVRGQATSRNKFSFGVKAGQLILQRQFDHPLTLAK